MSTTLNITGADSSFFDSKYRIVEVYSKSLERSLIIIFAFIFYTITNYYKNDIYKYIPYGKKYYDYFLLLFNFIFILCSYILIFYIFGVIFKLPI
jgi:hypothetical protein